MRITTDHVKQLIKEELHKLFLEKVDPKDLAKLNNARTEKERKSIYRQLSFKYHPDRGGSNEDFQELSSAYKTPQKNSSMLDQKRWGSFLIELIKWMKQSNYTLKTQQTIAKEIDRLRGVNSSKFRARLARLINNLVDKEISKGFAQQAIRHMNSLKWHPLGAEDLKEIFRIANLKY
tara:strand:- start:60 stop:590 length:531 start_codon:yes stop_codon:yes gene_type:complete